MAICLFGAASALLAIILSFLSFGEVTLYAQCRDKLRQRRADSVTHAEPSRTDETTA